MKQSLIKKVKMGIYKTFLMFMICISMGMDPIIQDEIKKMLERMNEVCIEQIEITEDTDGEDSDEIK